MAGVHGPLGRALLVLALAAPVDSLDRQVQRAVQEWRSPALETPMRLASSGGRGVLVLSSLVVMAVAGGPLGPVTARTTLVVLVPVNLAVELLKRVVGRERPDGEHSRSNASFPSSHAANAACLALLLSRRWRKLAPLFWLLAAVVCFSRLYLNRHFLSDVLCGVGIGLAGGWIVVEWLHRRGWGWEKRA